MYEIWTKNCSTYILNTNIKSDYFIVTPRTTIFHCHVFVDLKEGLVFLILFLVKKKKTAEFLSIGGNKKVIWKY